MCILAKGILAHVYTRFNRTLVFYGKILRYAQIFKWGGSRKIMQYFQRLRDCREDKDMSQKEVAAILNTSQEQYSRGERGAWQMPIEHFKTLARYYNVSLDYLAGLIDTPRALK